MNDPLEEAYLRWLIEQVREYGGHPSKTYWDVLRLMHAKEFVWVVANDDNRIVDGQDLRAEFLLDRNGRTFLSTDKFGPVSVLEVMIVLSRRLEFFAGGGAEGWAWQLLRNLGMDRMADPLSRYKKAKADAILESLIWRTYSQDGQGGFFPLAWPQRDQTKIELWYQMADYVNEIHPEY